MRVIAIAFLFLLFSCSPQIKKDDVTVEDCFIFLKCLEMNQKNSDKSSCMLLQEGCRDAMRDKRKVKQ